MSSKEGMLARPKKEKPRPPKFVQGLKEGTLEDLPLNELKLEYRDLEFRLSPRVNDLVEDIKQNGQQFPIIVRPLSPEGYEVISGYRRVRAIQEIGWNTVKAIVRTDLIKDDDAYRVSFLENEKRKNLTGVDKAHAIAKLELLGKTAEEVQAIYGIGVRQYQRYKKVGEFPDMLKDAVSKLKISTGHGLMLMQAFKQHGKKVKLEEWVKRIGEEDLSVKQLQRRLNKELGKPKKPKARYFEKQKDGGFRLYPMRFDPKRTDEATKATMATKLKEALALLEEK